MAGTFALDLARFATKAKGNMDKVVRKVVLDLSTRIVLRSPVRTGRFRANWQYGETVMPRGSTQTAVPSGVPAGSILGGLLTELRSRSIVDKSGNATLRKIRAGVKPEAAGKVHWLANNLPYAQPLEYGHSKQAPAGMVGRRLEPDRPP